MPLKRFLMLSRNVDRLHAEEDLRRMAIACSAQSPEGAKRMFDDLRARLGTVAEEVPELPVPALPAPTTPEAIAAKAVDDEAELAAWRQLRTLF